MRVSRKLLPLLLMGALPALGAPDAPDAPEAPDAPASSAGSTAGPEEGAGPLVLSMSLLSFESRQSSRFPSWEQAVLATSDAFLFGQWLLKGATERLPTFWRVALRILGSFAVDGLVWLALPSGWAHEEGHRSVMGLHNIIGHNGVEDPRGAWPASYRPVYGMSDEQLAAFKLENNADFVRMQAAGWESELNTYLQIEKASFYYDQPGYMNVPILLYERLSPLLYLHACLDQEQMEGLFNDEVSAVGTNVHLRDFTGPDCTGWVYDLHRPNEPYADRGPHPSGVGLRRDRLPSDLSAEELSFLRRQRNLLLLSFLDPSLFGFSSFSATNPFNGRKFRFNAFLFHQLTSFGSSTDLHLLAAQDQLRVGATVHGFMNGQMLFPGLSGSIERFPVQLLGGTYNLSGSLSLWLQPRDQLLKTSEVTPGVMASITVARRLFSAVDLTARLRGKTAGWVAVVPQTGPAADFTLGVSLLLP
jgi:hypothetical protein